MFEVDVRVAPLVTLYNAPVKVNPDTPPRDAGGN